ncbi:MAG TPA: hypothetical protein VHQ64_15225, partial [Pyrinomonadaceae bacterium]|nr:hypothetical protein [Pyrinomonadaceae bacterium]
EAARQAEAQARRMADEEAQRLKQLEAVLEKAQSEAAQRAEREKELNAEVASLHAEVGRLQQLEAERDRSSETDTREPVFSAEVESLRIADARLKQLQADLQQAQAEIAQHAEREQQLEAEIESLRQANARAASGFAEVADDTFELVDTKSITLSDVDADAHDAWLPIDLHHSKPPVPAEKGLANVEQLPPQINLAPPVNGRRQAIIPSDIAERLQSSDSSQRAAALVDLADGGNQDSFELITNSFDDQSVEVRNAAARALYGFQPDLAASFTRALRESSPERRRKIGAAIAGSGLAANAINSLAGEGRDRTHDAFSILFLMAKAGETQPLMTAIAKHSNLDVRLTAVKLIGLSNQQSVLPALRHMAAREHLPAEVSGAIMEAIYLLSNQKHEVA